MRKTHIIGVGNQKGGVSKTTNTIHLAAALSERGYKCLVVDLDPNLGLTLSFDIPTTTFGAVHMLLGQEKAEDVIISHDTEQERASRPGEFITLPRNVDIIPANRRIENFDKEFASAAEEDDELQYVAPFDTLGGPLKELDGIYDFIFLDTAPNAGTLTLAAYKSATGFILSSTAEKLSVDALRRSMKDINAARKRVNPELGLIGVIMSQVDTRRKLQRAYITKVEKGQFDSDRDHGLFKTVVPSRAVIGKASTLCISLFEYEPIANEVKSTNEVRDVYRNLAQEVESRLGINVPVEQESAVDG